MTDPPPPKWSVPSPFSFFPTLCSLHYRAPKRPVPTTSCCLLLLLYFMKLFYFSNICRLQGERCTNRASLDFTHSEYCSLEGSAAFSAEFRVEKFVDLQKGIARARYPSYRGLQGASSTPLPHLRTPESVPLVLLAENRRLVVLRCGVSLAYSEYLYPTGCCFRARVLSQRFEYQVVLLAISSADTALGNHRSTLRSTQIREKR